MSETILLDESSLPTRIRILDPLKKSRNFRSLWLGQTLSQFGDSVLWVALPLCVYGRGQSTMVLGMLMGLLMLPQVILLPFAGTLVDRMSRVHAMIATESVRCLVVLLLSVLSMLHQLSTMTMVGFVLLYGIMDALFQPAYSAARAQVFTQDIRNQALSLTQVSQQGARLLGPALGGAVIGLTSVAVGFAMDATMLLISVVTLLFLHIPKPLTHTNPTSSPFKGFWQDMTSGFTYLRKHDWLWITILAFGFLNIGTSGLSTILVPWLVKIHLHMSDSAFGLVSSASGIGAILMALVFGRRDRWRWRGYLGYGGIAMSAVSLLCLSFSHTVFALMLFVCTAGAGSMLFGLVWEGSLQELIPTEAYGRVASIDLFGSWALLPVGNLFTGWLANQIGGIHALIGESVFVVLIVMCSFMVPAIRRFD